jgi:hypothetical protein
MNSRDGLKDGEKKIEAFLTHFAVNRKVAPASQNQAMNAWVFFLLAINRRIHAAV